VATPRKYHTDLPEELSNEFDKIVKMYYFNEAESVRDAIRRMVFEFKNSSGKNQGLESKIKEKEGGVL
jgi:metal-responsive CopG/Arc/MetJ family transcriptional regulator